MHRTLIFNTNFQVENTFILANVFFSGVVILLQRFCYNIASQHFDGFDAFKLVSSI